MDSMFGKYWVKMELYWPKPKFYYQAAEIVNGKKVRRLGAVMEGFQEYQKQILDSFQAYCQFCLKYKRKPKMKITFF